MNLKLSGDPFTFDPDVAHGWLNDEGDDEGTVADEEGIDTGWGDAGGNLNEAVKDLGNLLANAPAQVLGRLDGYDLMVDALVDSEDYLYRVIVDLPNGVSLASHIGHARHLFHVDRIHAMAVHGVERAIAAMGTRVVDEATDLVRGAKVVELDRGMLAGLFRTCSAGRHEYAQKATGDSKDWLEHDAVTLESVACVIEGDDGPLYGWLPSWRWTDEMNAKLDAEQPPTFCTFGHCTNPGHDHTTKVDHEGNELPKPVWMLCKHCGLPTHYDKSIEEYQHDDPDAPDCFLIRRVNPAERAR